MMASWHNLVEWMNFRWGWIICAASFSIHAGIYILGYSFSLLFVDIQRDLNATAVETGWIGSVMWGVQMFSSPLGSFLMSSLSCRPALILVIITGSGAVFVSSFAQSVQQLFVTLGAVYGISLGVGWFIMLSVMLQYFPSKNSVRSLSFATLGGTTALLVGSEPISWCVDTLGWRRTLQIISSFSFIVALPAALLVYPPKVNQGATSSKGGCDNDVKTAGSNTSNERRSVSNQHKATSTSAETSHQSYDREPLEIDVDGSKRDDIIESDDARRTGRLERWKRVISVDACLYSVFTITCAMAWSVFFVNIVSFYESVGVSSRLGGILLTISAVSEFVTKVVLATVGELFPLRKTYLLLGKIVMVILLSSAMAFATTFPQFVVLGMITGVLRACFHILLYPCSIETLGSGYSDEVLILTCVSRGIGFLIGTLPAGAIYDKLGSYQLSFLVVTCISVVSALSLSSILLRQNLAARKRAQSSQRRLKNELSKTKNIYLQVPRETTV